MARYSVGKEKRRKRLEVKYGHLYFPFKPPGHWSEAACVYCGNQAQSMDHIPPLVWMDALGSDYFKSSGLLVCKVPACLQCNCTLGDERLFTIIERTGYLLERYKKKYRKFSQSPVWTDDQLKELRGNLRKQITNFSVVQLGIGRRIAILEENCAVRSMRETIHDQT